jgi:hypothetical protein
LTQSHALIRDGSDYADLFTLGANHCATLPELATHPPNPNRDHVMTMSKTEIERALRELRLSGITATLETRILQAQANGQPFLETFCLLLQDELDGRRTRLTERRFKTSGLDERPDTD